MGLHCEILGAASKKLAFNSWGVFGFFIYWLFKYDLLNATAPFLVHEVRASTCVSVDVRKATDIDAEGSQLGVHEAVPISCRGGPPGPIFGDLCTTRIHCSNNDIHQICRFSFYFCFHVIFRWFIAPSALASKTPGDQYFEIGWLSRYRNWP